MSKRIYLVLAVLWLPLLAPFVAMAQQQEPPVYTFVAQWGVPRAQWAEFTAFWEKNSRPIVERLLADGTLVEWGSFADVVHRENGFTHGNWFTAKSVAGIERALGELLKLPPNPAVSAAKHGDILVRSLTRRTRTASGSGYGWVSSSQVQPGKAQEWRELWEKYTKPTYEQLLANGTITFYEVSVEHVHTENPGWRYIVYEAPSPDAIDKVNAAFDALSQKRTAEENRAIGAAFREVTVPGAHRDFFYRITNYARK